MGLSKFKSGGLSHWVLVLLRWDRISMIEALEPVVMNDSHLLSLSTFPAAALSSSSSCSLSLRPIPAHLFTTFHLLLFLLLLILIEVSSYSFLFNQAGIEKPLLSS